MCVNLLTYKVSAVYHTRYLYLLCIAAPYQVHLVYDGCRCTTSHPPSNLPPDTIRSPVVEVNNFHSVHHSSNVNCEFSVISATAVLVSLWSPTTTASNLSTFHHQLSSFKKLTRVLKMLHGNVKENCAKCNEVWATTLSWINISFEVTAVQFMHRVALHSANDVLQQFTAQMCIIQYINCDNRRPY